MNATEKRTVRIESLEEYCNEFGCSKREGLIDVLLMLHEGITCMDLLEAKLTAMSDATLMETYLNF